jgi:hypothetical protein
MFFVSFLSQMWARNNGLAVLSDMPQNKNETFFSVMIHLRGYYNMLKCFTFTMILETERDLRSLKSKVTMTSFCLFFCLSFGLNLQYFHKHLKEKCWQRKSFIQFCVLTRLFVSFCSFVCLRPWCLSHRDSGKTDCFVIFSVFALVCCFLFIVVYFL